MASNNPTDRTDLEDGDFTGKQSRTQTNLMDQIESPPGLNSSVAHSPLFRLSPELRNQIYRLVLILEEEAIVVNKANGIPEPALLRSNKVIRAEAFDIYYLENEIECPIHNFDPAPILMLQSKLKMPLRDYPGRIFIYRERPYRGAVTWDQRDRDRDVRWNNLKSWLHMCHKDQFPGLYDHKLYGAHFDFERRAEVGILKGLFDVAKHCPEMPSKTLDCVIKSMHYALKEANMAQW